MAEAILGKKRVMSPRSQQFRKPQYQETDYAGDENSPRDINQRQPVDLSDMSDRYPEGRVTEPNEPVDVAPSPYNWEEAKFGKPKSVAAMMPKVVVTAKRDKPPAEQPNNDWSMSDSGQLAKPRKKLDPVSIIGTALRVYAQGAPGYFESKDRKEAQQSEMEQHNLERGQDVAFRDRQLAQQKELSQEKPTLESMALRLMEKPNLNDQENAIISLYKKSKNKNMSMNQYAAELAQKPAEDRNDEDNKIIEAAMEGMKKGGIFSLFGDNQGTVTPPKINTIIDNSRTSED